MPGAAKSLLVVGVALLAAVCVDQITRRACRVHCPEEQQDVAERQVALMQHAAPAPPLEMASVDAPDLEPDRTVAPPMHGLRYWFVMCLESLIGRRAFLAATFSSLLR